MGNVLKGQVSSKFPSSVIFFYAGENKTVKCRFKAILSVRQLCTDRCGGICLRNTLNRM